MSSAIYTPSSPYVEEIFHVSPAAASLGLALYVLGYGTGPLLFSPLSEIPVIGRNPPYMATFGIFVILAVPTALVDNFAGLLVLRFLQGFFGSPCLATGGASIGDLYSLIKLPYFLTGWAAFATLGPALGPVISGFSVPAENWDVAWNNIVRPFQITIMDPAVLFTALYTSLVYGIYYSFFEVFPLVYPAIYHFNIGEMGLVFLVIVVAIAIAIPSYFIYLRYVFEPEILTKGLLGPERRLVPALFASFLPPIGLFLFGWTSRSSVHWIASVIGIGIYCVGIFIIIQCIFIWLPLTYPQYAASLFAGNDFARSALAAGAILFARPLFINLGIGPGVSLLAAFTVACIAGIWALWWFGEGLRKRSRFAAK
ncbi:MAG: hypothetical protein Q9227_007358 [Pyrenula ochraceoflavens]